MVGVSAPLSMDDSSVPPVFQKCAEMQRGSDEKFARCAVPLGSDPCAMLQEMHRAEAFRTYFLAVLPTIISLVALILNAGFLVLQLIAWRQSGSWHRKRYIFVLFRSATTLLTILLYYVMLIIAMRDGFNYPSVAILLFLANHDFASIACSYLAQTSLLYLAVMHPIFYRVSIRCFHCYLALAAIVVVNLFVSIVIGMYGATLFYPNNALVTCSFEGCRYPLAIFEVSALGLGVLAVLLLYGILLARMRLRIKWTNCQNSIRSSSSSTPSSLSSYVAMNRLAFNMGAFGAVTIPMFAVAVVIVCQLRKLSPLGELKSTPCKTFENGSLFVLGELLSSAALVIWNYPRSLEAACEKLTFEFAHDIVKRFGECVGGYSWQERTFSYSDCRSRIQPCCMDLTQTETNETTKSAVHLFLFSAILFFVAAIASF